ncbi:hypothetical protein EYS42_11255 [Aquabacterium lacunae]|uniref:HAF repeat-containing protein n=1 Tax=Aquabacterium lacunae TaxID=2528630 RepID=A0A4Q9GXD5_9BURK|nr:hypothetical protein [Aquabacterium lacunae]TBO30263.1 hypothetical protein EYS42_11255 [Aquabacterium lacunae]
MHRILMASVLVGMVGLAQAQSPSGYTTTELTLPSGTTGCVQPRVNARGDVLAECGYKKTVKRVGGIGDNPGGLLFNLFRSTTVSTTFLRPVLWKAGQRTTPQTLPDAVVPTTSADSVRVVGFNALGEVLLRHQVSSAAGVSLWRNGAWQALNLGASGFFSGSSVVLNDQGALAFPVLDAAGNTAVLVRERSGQELRTAPFLRSDGYTQPLSDLGFNNLGQVAMGLLRPSSGCCPTGCVSTTGCYSEPLVSQWWNGSAWRALPMLAAGNAFLPVALNDHGLAVGHASVRDASGATLMHVWDGATYQRLGVGSGTVTGINRAGTVVGTQNGLVTYKGVSTSGAFVWRQGTLTALQQLVSIGSGQALLNAPGLNDAGQIAATAADPLRTAGRLYLFTPR